MTTGNQEVLLTKKQLIKYFKIYYHLDYIGFEDSIFEKLTEEFKKSVNKATKDDVKWKINHIIAHGELVDMSKGFKVILKQKYPKKKFIVYGYNKKGVEIVKRITSKLES